MPASTGPPACSLSHRAPWVKSTGLVGREGQLLGHLELDHRGQFAGGVGRRERLLSTAWARPTHIALGRRTGAAWPPAS